MEDISWEINEIDHTCWDSISGKIHRTISNLGYAQLTVLTHREVFPVEISIRGQVEQDRRKDV